MHLFVAGISPLRRALLQASFHCGWRPCLRTLPTGSRLVLYTSCRKRLLTYSPSLRGAIFRKNSVAQTWVQIDFLKLGNASLGPSHVQLILAALLLYPFGIKEGPKRHVLSRVPLSGFCQDYPAPLLFRRFWDPGFLVTGRCRMDGWRRRRGAKCV